MPKCFVTLLKLHFVIDVVMSFSCIFSEYLSLRALLEDSFCCDFLRCVTLKIFLKSITLFVNGSGICNLYMLSMLSLQLDIALNSAQSLNSIISNTYKKVANLQKCLVIDTNRNFEILEQPILNNSSNFSKRFLPVSYNFLENFNQKSLKLCPTSQKSFF